MKIIKRRSREFTHLINEIQNGFFLMYYYEVASRNNDDIHGYGSTIPVVDKEYQISILKRKCKNPIIERELDDTLIGFPEEFCQIVDEHKYMLKQGKTYYFFIKDVAQRRKNIINKIC